MEENLITFRTAIAYVRISKAINIAHKSVFTVLINTVGELSVEHEELKTDIELWDWMQKMKGLEAV